MQRRALHCVRVTAHSARDCREQLDRAAPARHLTVAVITNAQNEVRDGQRARQLLAALSECRSADGVAPDHGSGSSAGTSSSEGSNVGINADNRRAVIALFSGAPFRAASLRYPVVPWHSEFRRPAPAVNQLLASRRLGPVGAHLPLATSAASVVSSASDTVPLANLGTTSGADSAANTSVSSQVQPFDAPTITAFAVTFDADSSAETASAIRVRTFQTFGGAVPPFSDLSTWIPRQPDPKHSAHSSSSPSPNLSPNPPPPHFVWFQTNGESLGPRTDADGDEDSNGDDDFTRRLRALFPSSATATAAVCLKSERVDLAVDTRLMSDNTVDGGVTHSISLNGTTEGAVGVAVSGVSASEIGLLARRVLGNIQSASMRLTNVVTSEDSSSVREPSPLDRGLNATPSGGAGATEASRVESDKHAGDRPKSSEDQKRSLVVRFGIENEMCDKKSITLPFRQFRLGLSDAMANLFYPTDEDLPSPALESAHASASFARRVDSNGSAARRYRHLSTSGDGDVDSHAQVMYISDNDKFTRILMQIADAKREQRTIVFPMPAFEEGSAAVGGGGDADLATRCRIVDLAWPYRPINAAPVSTSSKEESLYLPPTLNPTVPFAKLVLCPLARVRIVGLSQRVDSFGAIEAQTQAVDADEDEDAIRNERVALRGSDESNPGCQSDQLATAATHGSAHEDETSYAAERVLVGDCIAALAAWVAWHALYLSEFGLPASSFSPSSAESSPPSASARNASAATINAASIRRLSSAERHLVALEHLLGASPPLKPSQSSSPSSPPLPSSPSLPSSSSHQFQHSLEEMIAIAEQANRKLDTGISTMAASTAAAASPASVASSQSPADCQDAAASGLLSPARQPAYVLDLPQPSWSARSLAAWLFRYLPVSAPPKLAAPSKSSASAPATTAADALRLSWFAAPSAVATLEMQRDYMRDVIKDYQAFFAARAASTRLKPHKAAGAGADSDSKAGDAVRGKSATRVGESKMVRRRSNRVHPKPL